MSEIKRGRPRKYLTGAERTAACRARNRHKQPMKVHQAGNAARDLERSINLAALAGNTLAMRFYSEEPGRVIQNLIAYFDATTYDEKQKLNRALTGLEF